MAGPLSCRLKNLIECIFLLGMLVAQNIFIEIIPNLHQLNWNVDLLKNIMPQLQKHKTPFVFCIKPTGGRDRRGIWFNKKIGGSCGQNK